MDTPLSTSIGTGIPRIGHTVKSTGAGVENKVGNGVTGQNVSRTGHGTFTADRPGEVYGERVVVLPPCGYLGRTVIVYSAGLHFPSIVRYPTELSSVTY